MRLNYFGLIFSAALSVSMLTLSTSVYSQDANSDKAKDQCEKALQKSAKQSGKDYVNRACDNNAYSTAFWQCVEEELDLFDLAMSINFCEKRFGFR